MADRHIHKILPMKPTTKTLSASFGGYIRKMRINKGYSQYDMAYSLNISQNSYWLLENGKTKLTVEHIEAISKKLDMSFEVFIQGYFSLNANNR